MLVRYSLPPTSSSSSSAPTPLRLLRRPKSTPMQSLPASCRLRKIVVPGPSLVLLPVVLMLPMLRREGHARQLHILLLTMRIVTATSSNGEPRNATRATAL